MDRSLRIRLEGADEALEQFIADCATVKELLTGQGWRTRLRGNAVAAALTRSQARISRARTACAMVGQQPEVEQLLGRARLAEGELTLRLTELLRGSEGSVHQKLARLIRLVEPVQLAPGERVLQTFETPEGRLTVTQTREFFEDAEGDAVNSGVLLELLLRIRRELNITGAPRHDPGLITFLPVLRYEQNRTLRGNCLAWRSHLLFLPRRQTGDLLTALLRPRRHEPAIEASDGEVLGLIACVLPWIETELAARLEHAGLDWLWAWRDVAQAGRVLRHRRCELPAYRILGDEPHAETAGEPGHAGELHVSPRFTTRVRSRACDGW